MASNDLFTFYLRYIVLTALLSTLAIVSRAQSSGTHLLDSLITSLDHAETTVSEIRNQIASHKSGMYKQDLLAYGLPSIDYIEHTAYYIEYDEQHEQAKWVAHIIAPEIKDLGSGRTNDFRVDPKVTTGTAEQDDYFIVHPSRKGKEKYEGFGFDRGHLAPSADFRWYAKAVSESYYYSNMSPQRPELNQEKWAELESALRSYVLQHEVPLAIITGPVLHDSLPKIVRSPNGVSIPEYFYKVVYDHTNQRAIAFLMGNTKLAKPVDSYALSIDELESFVGLDFFSEIDQSLEANLEVEDWFSEYDNGAVAPISQNTLPPGHYNTIAGAKQANTYSAVTVCGKVVSSRNSRKGHAWLNLDRPYPNDYFSVMIYKSNLTNFTYDPVTYLKDKNICVTGEIGKFGNKPVMKVKRPSSVLSTSP